MIHGVTITAFEDELSKIAMDQANKDKLKRFGLATLAAGLGTGIGIGMGRLITRSLERKLGPAKTVALKSNLIRYGVPTATGFVATLATTIGRRTADKYIDQGEPKKLKK